MKLFLTLLFLSVIGLTQAQMQTFTGNLPQLKGNEIVLMGYDGFQQKELARTLCDSTGSFQLSYRSSYTGAALLQVTGGENVIVLLAGENFGMQWNNIHDINTLTFTHSPENDAFAKGVIINQQAEQKLAGLKYLLPKYEKDKDKYQWLTLEIALQENLFQHYVNHLSQTLYAANYLQIRKLITDMSQTAEHYPERMPQHETEFKNLNFDDDNLWHSGLMGELFAGFYQLMENYKEPDTVTAHTNPGTDAWIKSLSPNPTRRQDVAEYCFKMLEMHNLTGASEYLAKAMLNQSDCLLDEKRTNLFEQYRKMAVGNTAPDILLQDGKKLSELNPKYKLVVFGASWCPNCQRDYPSLVGCYKRIKDKCNIEFVYVSLDKDKVTCDEFYKEAPFRVSCDTKGWDGPAVKAFYVAATPTMYLLDETLHIIKKIVSPQQLEACMSELE